MFRNLAAFAACIGALMLTGCGEPKSAIVRGKAQMDGKPLAGAELQFIPAKDATLGQHTISTGPDGTFVLQGEKGNPPVKPGSYLVVVNKWQVGASGGMDGMNNEVPVIYRQQATTSLRAEIKDGDTTLETFELTTKPGILRK